MTKSTHPFFALALLLLLAAWWPRPPSAAARSYEHRVAPPQALSADYFADPSNSLTIGQVASPAYAGRFRPSGQLRYNFGFSPSTFWFRFPPPATRPNKLLEIDCPLLDQVTLYQPDNKGGFQAREGGQLLPIRLRPLPHRNPVFPLHPPEPGEPPSYLRCQNQGSVFFALKLWTREGFAHKSQQELYLLAFYYLTLGGLALYNGVVFFLTRARSYAFYLAFIASFALWQLDYNGLAGQYLWPGHPGWSNLVTPIAINLTGLCALLFSREFLHTPVNTPRLDRILTLILPALAAAMLLGLQPQYRLSLIAATIMVILYTPLLMAAGAIRWRQGSRPAGYYTVAWSALVLGSITLALKCLGLLPSNLVTEYGQQLGAVIEMYLLSLALVDNYCLVRKEKEAIQAAALAERENDQLRLAALVATKTKELQGSTLNLERLSAKLAKYLSPQLYQSIFSGQTEVELKSSRKMLTVFFSDIKNFTRITDTIESEELTSFLNDYLNEMAELALAHGGTIDKFIGDGIMIFFGDPESKGVKEDALACIRMALAMQATVRGFKRRELSYLLAEPLHIRMGINTGYCTVGNFGSASRLDYTIIGGQVNLAARLEKAAGDDEILISAKTRELVKEQVHCRQKARLTVKGIAHPVLTYSVIGARLETEPREYCGPERRRPPSSLPATIS